MVSQSATHLPLVPFGGDAFVASLVRGGRTTIELACPVDVAAAVDVIIAGNGATSFWTYAERPLSSAVLLDTVTAYVAKRITAGELDASDGPVLTTGTLYRMGGQILPIKPDRASSKGQTVETLPALAVLTAARYRSLLDESIRGLVTVKVPAAWTQAETDRASKADPAIDAAPVDAPAITDGQFAVLVVEPFFVQTGTVERDCEDCGETVENAAGGWTMCAACRRAPVTVESGS